jgi:hypothetical protein
MKASYLLSAVAWASTAAAGFAQTPAAEAELPIRPEAARAFPGYVQPVLMNLCAKCHCRPDHAGGFKLARIGEGYASPQATARNLRTTAAFVKADEPASSPLLLKALAPHGGAKDAPFTNRGHPAFKNLEAWVMAALPPVPRTEPVLRPVAATVPAATPPAVIPAAGSEFPAVAAPRLEPPPAVAPRPGKPNPDDPFDPSQFNRR